MHSENEVKDNQKFDSSVLEESKQAKTEVRIESSSKKTGANPGNKIFMSLS